MKGTTPANPQSERGNLGVAHVNARGVRSRSGLNAQFSKRADDGLFDLVHQRTYTKFFASQIDHQVNHELAGTVVGHLPAPIHRDHRDVARGKNMFGLPRLALGINPRMLQTPEFIRHTVIAVSGEGFHGLPGFLIGLLTQGSDNQVRHRAQSTMCTRPLALRSSNRAFSCASPVATIFS